MKRNITTAYYIVSLEDAYYNAQRRTKNFVVREHAEKVLEECRNRNDGLTYQIVTEPLWLTAKEYDFRANMEVH